MKILDIHTRTGRIQVNLDNVAMWRVDEGHQGLNPSFDIFFVGDETPLRINLARNKKDFHVFDRLKIALMPLYESRVGMVMGIYIPFDLTPLQE